MKLSKIFSVGLLALSVVAVSAPSVMAHNTLKYTNIPFVVPAFCSSATASVVSTGGKATVQVSAPSTGFGGWEVYCSVPTSGTLPTTATGTFSQGTLTCNFTSNVTLIPTSGPTQNCGAWTYVNNAGASEFAVAATTLSGNVMTLSCTNATFPSAPVIAVGFGMSPSTGTITATFNNFRYNNSPLLFDTTVSDSSAAVNAAGTENFCGP